MVDSEKTVWQALSKTYSDVYPFFDALCWNFLVDWVIKGGSALVLIILSSRFFCRMLFSRIAVFSLSFVYFGCVWTKAVFLVECLQDCLSPQFTFTKGQNASSGQLWISICNKSFNHFTLPLFCQVRVRKATIGISYLLCHYYYRKDKKYHWEHSNTLNISLEGKLSSLFSEAFLHSSYFFVASTPPPRHFQGNLNLRSRFHNK